MTTGLSAGLTPPRPSVGRPRRPTRWAGAGTGSTGIDAAIAAAVAAEGALVDTDILVTDDSVYEHTILDGNRGTHQWPTALGVLDRTNTSGFAGINPVGAVTGWTHDGAAGSPTYDVVSGRLRMVAPTASDSAAIRWAVSTVAGVHALRIVDLEASGGTQSVVITLATATSSGRYMQIRNQSGVWEIRTSTSAWTSMGQSTGTAATLELRYNPTTQSIYYRWGSAGSWTEVTGYTVASGLGLRLWIDLTYVSAVTTCYVRSILCGKVAA